ncbi:SPOSA6832_05039, partial [Sporobolomyces salmonicolor]
MVLLPPPPRSSHPLVHRLHRQLAFLSPALLVDWAVILALGGAARWVEHQYPYERDPAHYLADPDVSWPHVQHERVPAGPGGMLDQLTWYLPLAVMGVIGAARRSARDVHHAVMGLAASRAVMRLVVECLKNRVGRLRPDFLARCAWDDVAKACTGRLALVKDGRRSFPSGPPLVDSLARPLLPRSLPRRQERCAPRARSSSSLSPLLTRPLIQPGAFAFAARFPRSGLLQSRLLRFALAIAPLFVAGWICVTRLEDHYHHPTDVLAGSVIGLASALVVYPVFYPSPFLLFSPSPPSTLSSFPSASPTAEELLAVMDRPKRIYGALEGGWEDDEEGTVRLEEGEGRGSGIGEVGGTEEEARVPRGSEAAEV